MTKDDYARVRKPFVPLETKPIFVCESPPISGPYFYDPSNGFHGPLFTAMMRDVLEFEPDSKERGLHERANRGYLLLDATYQPVNGEGIARGLDDSRMLDILTKMRRETPLDPVKVYREPETGAIVLAAGAHRYFASAALCCTTIPCEYVEPRQAD
jgi:hypothetical protein